MDDRAVRNPRPSARARRFTDDDVCDVVRVGVGEGRASGNAPVLFRVPSPPRPPIACSETQRVGNAIAFLLAELQVAAAFDGQRG